MARKAKSSGSLRVRRADSAFVARGDPPEDLAIVRSEGSFLFDSRGKRYLDFVMGWCAGNLGWANPEIREQLRRFDGPDYVHPSYLYRPWTELAGLLAELAPGELRKSYRATGGTEAVEIALQIAMAYTGRPGFISIEGSYHGNSIGAVSVASSDGSKELPNTLKHCHRVRPPLDEAAAAKVEKLLEKRKIAALIMEPIVCNLGVLIPAADFMTEVARLCRKHGTLLIMDEVATGFGRTGKLFASEHFELEPDLLCLGKAITAGHAPMGATMTTDRIARAVEGKVSFYSTYGWHPLSVAAALANLRIWRRDRRSLLANVAARSKDFAERLVQLPFKSSATIRVKGLAIGIEFEDEGYADRLSEECREAGLLISGEEDTVTLFPALTIDEQTARAGLDVIERCL
jgi:4-aminobutyrate aminotransferase-like enzyme